MKPLLITILLLNCTSMFADGIVSITSGNTQVGGTVSASALNVSTITITNGITASNFTALATPGFIGDGSGLTGVTAGTGPFTNTCIGYGDLHGTNAIFINPAGTILSNANGSVTASGGALYDVIANNASTTSQGITLTNSTIATSGNPKASSRIDMWGNGFGTTGSTNAPVGFTIGVVPTSAATAGGLIVVSNALGAAAPTEVFRVTQAGAATFGSSVSGTTLSATTASSFGNIQLGGGQAQIGEPANSVVGVYNSSSTGNAAFVFNLRQLTKTSNYTLLATECGTVVNNIGAGGAVTNTLPTAVAGMHYYFYVDAAQILCVQATGSDTIRDVGTVSATAGNVFSSTVGSTVHIFSPAALKWVIDTERGTWTGPQ